MDKEKSKDKYVEAVGRRKTSTARVRILKAAKTHVIVNGQEAKDYFKTDSLRRLIMDPLVKGPSENADAGTEKWEIEAKVSGGGINSQAEAIRLGLARALVATDETLRTGLKTLGFLKRDARAKERRKFGLKKARKAPQWSKR